MSSTDKRIVVLEFDNAAFESGVSQTLKTLSSLEKSIEATEKSAASLDDLTKAANNVSFANIINQTDDASAAFSAFQAVAFGVFATLGAKAEELGEKLVQNLGMKQAIVGWRKYNDEVASVQMMVNAGYDLMTVERNLDKLMTYADETSYSYDAMVSAISKFTTYGLDLSESVVALEGFNNAAALMGVNAENASHALTGLTGAMAQGYMAANNWKWFSTARMTGVALTSAFIEAGEAVGTLERVLDEESGVEYLRDVNKGLEVSTKTFQSTLSSKWLTNDVMMRALNSYGKYMDDVVNLETAFGITFGEATQLASVLKDMSGNDWGWSESAKTAAAAAQQAKTLQEAIDSVYDAASSRWKAIWKLIAGNYDEARVLFTDLANYLYEVFVDPLWDLSDMIEGWKGLGGRVQLFGGVDPETGEAFGALYLAAESLKEVIDTVREALGDLFAFLHTEDGEDTAIEELAKELFGWVTDYGKAADEAVGSIDTMYEAADALASGEEEASYQASVLYNLTVKFRDKVKEITDFISDHTDDLKSIVYALIAPLSIIVRLARGLIKIVKAIANNTLVPVLKGLLSVIVNITTHFGNLMKRVNDVVRQFTGFETATEAINKALAPIKSKIEVIFQKVNKGIDTFARWLNLLIDIVKGSDSMSEAFEKVTDKFESKGGGWARIADVFKKIRDTIQKVWPTIKSFGENVATSFSNLKEAIKNSLTSADNETGSFKQAFSSHVDAIKRKANELGVGDKIKAFFDRIGEAFKNVDWVSVLDKISNAFEVFKTVLGNVWKAIKSVWEYIKPVFSKLGEEIKEFWNTYMQGETLASLGVKGGLIGLLITFIKKVKDYESPFSSITEAIIGVFKKLSSVLQEYQNSIHADVIKKIAISVAILAASVIALALIDDKALEKAIAILSMIFSGLAILFSIVSKGYKTAETSGATKGIQEFLSKLGSGLSSFAKQIGKAAVIGLIGFALVQFAIAIGILAVAVYGLSKLDTAKLQQGILAVAELVGQMLVVMAAMAVVMNTHGSASAITAIALALITFSASVWILSSAVVKLSKVKTTDLERSMGAIETLAFIMGGMIVLISKINAADIGKVAGVLLAFSGSMVIIALAAKIINSIPVDGLIKTSLVIGAFAGAMVGFSWAVNSMKLNPGAMASVLIFAVALGILAGVTREISSIPWEGLLKAASVIVVATSALAGFSRLVDPKALYSAVGAVYAYLGALTALVLIVKAFSLVSWDDLGKAGAALAGFLTILTVFGAIGSKFKGIQKALKTMATSAVMIGAALLAAGAGIYLFSLAIDKLYLSAYKIPGILLQIIKGLADMSTDLALSLQKLIGTAIDTALKILVEYTPQISFAVVELLLATLRSIRDYAADITDVVLDIIDIVLTQIAPHVPDIATKVFNIVGDILVALVEHIKTVGIKNFAILGTVFAGLAGVLYFLGKNKATFKNALPTLGVMLLAVIAVGSVLAVLSLLDTDKLLNAALGLSVALTALTGAAWIIAQLGKGGVASVKGALFGIAAFAIIIGGLQTIAITLVATTYGLMEAIKAIAGDSTIDFVKIINDASEVLAALGEALGKFIGGIATGFVETALPALGAALSDFMINLKPFIEVARTMDDTTLKAIGLLIAMILALSVAEFIDALTNNPLLNFGSTSSFTKLGRQLVSFASSMVLFAAAISPLSEDSLSKVALAAQAGQAMGLFAQSIPRSGGLLEGLIGEKDIAKFGRQVKAFISAIVWSAADANSITEDHKTHFEIAADAGRAMADLADAIPRTGGSLQQLIGEKDIQKFGRQVHAFIQAISWSTADANQITENTKTHFEVAAEAGKAMAKLADVIPRTGGFVQDLLGEQDLADFGKKVRTFCMYLMSALGHLSGISSADADNIKLATEAGTYFAEFQHVIPDGTGEWFKKLIGIDEMKIFGDKIVAFMTGLGEALNKLNEISFSKYAGERMITAAQAGLQLADLAHSISDLNFTIGAPNIDAFSEQIIIYTKNIGKVLLALDALKPTTHDTDRIETIVGIGTKLADLGHTISDLNTDLGNNDETTLTKFGNSIKAYVDTSKEVIQGLRDDTPSDDDLSNIGNIVAIGTAISKLADNVRNNGGVTLIGGDTGTIETFGYQMAAYVTAIAAVFAAVKNTDINASDTDKIKQIARVSSDFASMAQAAQTLRSLNEVLASVDLSDFGEKLSSFAEHINTFSEDLFGIDLSGIDVVLDGLEKLSGGIIDAATASVNKFESRFILGKTSTSRIVGDWIQAIVDVIDLEAFTEAGEDCLNNFKNGLSDPQSIQSVQSAAISLLSKTRNAMTAWDYVNQFWTIGRDIAKGVASGITAYQYTVKTAAVNMVNLARNAAKVQAQIQSPSKVFADDIGKFIPLGVAYGINKFAYVASDSAELMVDGSVDAVRDALGRVIAVVNSEADYNPTITPVMDLSQVRNGVSYINGTFGGRGSLLGSVSSNISASIGASMATTALSTPEVYNDHNVISAIDRLESRLDNLSASISNMQVVLNSGALVGQIAEPMNRALGKISVRTNRGG